MKNLNYFNLKSAIEDDFGVTPIVISNQFKIPVRYYQTKITKNKLNGFQNLIYLKFESWDDKYILRDQITWDLGHPRTHHLVCSSAYKSVLEKSKLPPHRFYPAEIDVEGKIYNYFVLHFIQDYLKDMDYEKSQFCRAEILETEPILQKYKPGEIKSYKHFDKINEKLIEKMQWIYARRIVFKPEINYDIWGLQGQIILSEHIKNEIEKAGITGVSMPELSKSEMFKNIEIEMNYK